MICISSNDNLFSITIDSHISTTMRVTIIVFLHLIMTVYRVLPKPSIQVSRHDQMILTLSCISDRMDDKLAMFFQNGTVYLVSSSLKKCLPGQPRFNFCGSQRAYIAEIGYHASFNGEYFCQLEYTNGDMEQSEKTVIRIVDEPFVSFKHSIHYLLVSY